MALSSCEKLSVFFKGTTSKHNGDFYWLKCLHSYRTGNKLKKHKNVCENYDYCYVEMPKEDSKILKYNHEEKIYESSIHYFGDLEGLLEKISTHHNKLEKLLTNKINEHAASGYLLFTSYSFNTTKNKLDCYRAKDCMEIFFKDLKEHITKIINYKKRKKKC